MKVYKEGKSSYNFAAFHSNLLTKETIDGLRDVHKKLMGVSRPGMEIYGILAQDFWPLIRLNTELHEKFIDKTVNEDEPDAAIVLYENSDAFRFVDSLLNDKEHRIQNLTDKEDFLQSQQYISDVCTDLISFADSLAQSSVKSKISKRPVGRPKKTEFKDGYIFANGTTVSIRANPPVTRFCEAMFNLPIDKSIHWTDLYERIYEMHEAPRDGWRKIVAIIQRLNNKLKDMGAGPIFKFDGVESGTIRRLH